MCEWRYGQGGRADRRYATVITNLGEVVGVHTRSERRRVACEVTAFKYLCNSGVKGVHGRSSPLTRSTYRQVRFRSVIIAYLLLHPGRSVQLYDTEDWQVFSEEDMVEMVNGTR